MESRPTVVRHRVIGVSVLMAFMLYLDRVCLAEIVKSASFLRETGLSKEDIGNLLGAFFFTYALCQVPAGWLSDRFGARRMLPGYILLWSAFTALTGLATGFVALLLARLGCGVAQAGAYPTSQAVIRRWIPMSARARASSLVAFGGRVGGTLAPWLTASTVAVIGYWRPALWAYGGVGLAVAWAYWLMVRERPSEHPGCNEAERALIGRLPDPRPPSAREMAVMLGSFCRHRGLWLNAANQWFTNIGWTFLITWLPTYLKEEHGVNDLRGARMVSLALAFGMVGQLAGGCLADWSAKRFGLRWGRVFPMALGGGLAGGAYALCPFAGSAWAAVACFAVVSFATDLANPASWAFVQDVGGRATGATGGWGNMWGNFGAAVSPILVAKLMADERIGQTPLFFACAAAFLVASLLSLGMDATKPLAVRSPTEPDHLPGANTRDLSSNESSRH